jgi:hypothetical protein
VSDHEDKTVAAKWKGIQAPVVDRARDNPNVGIPFRDQTDDLVAQSFLEIDTDVGIGHQERTKRLGEKFRKGVGIGKHPHLAGETSRKGREVLLQALGLRQNPPGMLQERTARRRGRDPCPPPHQQGSSERQFHLADPG